VIAEVLGRGPWMDKVYAVPPGVDVEEFRPRPKAEALAGLLEECRHDLPNPPEAHNHRLPDAGNAGRLAAFLAADEPTVVFVGRISREKGAHVLVEALERTGLRCVMVGWGDSREELEARVDPGRILFTGPMEHRHLVHLFALGDVAATPSTFPEAFGMVAAEAAACGTPPLVARHSGLAEVADGLEQEYPEPLRDSWASRTARSRARGEARGDLPASAGRSRGAACGGPPCRGETVELGRDRRSDTFGRMGDEQRLSPDEQITLARQQFEDGTDFTLAIEEEFALLDPDSLGLVNRFEELPAGNPLEGTPRASHLVRDQIKTAAARRLTRPSAVPMALRDHAGRSAGDALGATGTPVEPLEGAAAHRHAPLPAQRQAAPPWSGATHVRAARASDPRRRSRGRRL
jgi:hypothetical protein